MEDIILAAVETYREECASLSFLPRRRYDRTAFPTIGQYDWLAGQVLYCLVRHVKPRRVIEFSTSSGYSTTFMALALRRNESGHVHSVDIDQAAQAAAAAWLGGVGVTEFVTLHRGDCRVVVPGLLDERVDLLFVDTLHSFDIACWYLERIVPRLPGEALVHIHDVMPPEARVRIHGGPPYPSDVDHRGPTVVQLLKRAVWRALHLENPNPFLKRPPREILPLHRLEVHQSRTIDRLPTIDGNYFEEAVLIRELLRGTDPTELVYLHRLAERLEFLEPGRFASDDRIGRSDELGRPLEWNDALWTRAEALCKAIAYRSPRRLARRLRSEFYR